MQCKARMKYYVIAALNKCAPSIRYLNAYSKLRCDACCHEQILLTGVQTLQNHKSFFIRPTCVSTVSVNIFGDLISIEQEGGCTC